MNAKGGRVAMRWAALLQVLLLLPAMLAGSICQHDDTGATFEVGCVCIHISAPDITDIIQLSAASDCGPCRDLVITAMVGGRVAASGMQPTECVEVPSHTEMRICPAYLRLPRLSGDPPGLPLSVLRC